MTAYVISEATILDAALADAYRALAQDSIARYEGRYVIRGGAVEVAEGEWPVEQRIIVVEFPSMDRAREWYDSPEYAEALKLRKQALSRRLLFVEGVDPANA
ncbi:MAG TPA: DUF1330 domain-containing protein [Chloroflexota bacterium]|nr:DUF1330 domain-containing protein [Chloroflexota bacterium]